VSEIPAGAAYATARKLLAKDPRYVNAPRKLERETLKVHPDSNNIGVEHGCKKAIADLRARWDSAKTTQEKSRIITPNKKQIALAYLLDRKKEDEGPPPYSKIQEVVSEVFGSGLHGDHIGLLIDQVFGDTDPDDDRKPAKSVAVEAFEMTGTELRLVKTLDGKEWAKKRTALFACRAADVKPPKPLVNYFDKIGKWPGGRPPESPPIQVFETIKLNREISIDELKKTLVSAKRKGATHVISVRTR